MVSRYRTTRGFTLIELILVVVILGILSAMIMPNLVGRSQEARVARAKADIMTLSNALDQFEIYNGTYPRNLSALLQDPKNPNRRYIRKLEKDPWGHDYIYVFPGRKNPHGFDLSSSGPDESPNTADDINNWD